MRYRLLLLLGLALPYRAAAQGQPAIATQLLLPGAECALFPAASMLKFVLAYGRFTPIWTQVVEAEQCLPTALRKQLPTSWQVRRQDNMQAYIQARLPTYRRQYFGFYNARHQPCLLINFFDSRQPALQEGWLHYRIAVEDGGADCWRLFYNLSTH